MQKISLQLTLDETNLVLEGLGHLAFAKVYGLVAKIQAQAGEQLKPRAAETPAVLATDGGTPLTP